MKTILFYIFLFALFYFEPTEIGPITLSQLWKIPLLVYLLINVVLLNKRSNTEFLKYSYGRSVKNLLNGGLFINYFVEVIDFIRYIMFPLMFEFISSKIKDIKILNKILLQFSQFIILSGLPFILGVLKSNGSVLYNIENLHSYTGIFQGPHGASITTAIAVLVLLYYIKSNKGNNWFLCLNSIISLLGVYLLFLTYVRTGYLMFLIGLIILFRPTKISMKQILTILLVISILTTGLLYLLKTNQNFYNRIFDIVNGEEKDVGSGRLLFWQASFDLWKGGNYFELLFGFGFERLTNKIFQVTDYRVFAHNEFFTQLGQNGLIGVYLFLGYIVSLYKFIKKRSKSPSYKLAISVFVLYVSLMLTQGGVWFPLDIFMVFIYVKLELENKIRKVLLIEISLLDK